MADDFPYNVFLSHHATDKAVVRPLAERLRKDGLKVWFDEWIPSPAGCPSPIRWEKVSAGRMRATGAGLGEVGRRPGEGRGAIGDSIPVKIEEGLEHSRGLVLCIRPCRIRFYFRSGPALNFSDRLSDLACAPACAILRAKCLPILEKHERRSWHARSRGGRRCRSTQQGCG